MSATPATVTPKPAAKTYPPGVTGPTAAFPWPHIAAPDVSGMNADVVACRAAGVPYKLGAKAPALSCKPSALVKGGIDCSGFVRRLLYQFADMTTFPDGSVVQHDWIKEQGFKKSDVASGDNTDGALRIAFLTPADGGGTGHVVLIFNGKTLESHGGVGPNRRAWTGSGWQSKAHVYVLSPPTVG